MQSQDLDITVAIRLSGESTLEKAAAKARERIDQLSNVSLDIAVTGRTGSGKSTFVNALRSVSNDNDGAAPTGVTETTKSPHLYEHPVFPNVKIWDLPGIGSPNFKAAKYLKDVNFEKYDFFIILSSERFGENDIMLAKEIKKKRKNFYFVRSKIDNDINAETKKQEFNKQEVLAKVRKDCEKHLKDCGNVKVFLISSFELQIFDFEQLQNTLEDDLPEHKKSALLQAWPLCSAKSLEKKIKVFTGLIWAASLSSGAVAVAPVPGLSAAFDTNILLLFFVRCYYAFGLDDESLTRLSEKVNIPLKNYRCKSKLATVITEKTASRLQVSVALAGIATIEYFTSIFPGVGSIIAAGLSFGTTQYILKQGLNELANTAREIIEVAGLDKLGI